MGSDFGDYTAHMASLVNLCAQCDIKNYFGIGLCQLENSYQFYSGFTCKFLKGDAHYFIVIAHLWPLGGDKNFFRKKEFCSVFIKEHS